MSVDALLDNETGEKEILMNKVSNTERLAGMIIKILRVLGVIIGAYAIFMVIALLALVIYGVIV